MRVAAIGVLAAVGLAAPEGWHSKLDDGVKAAQRSGKPVLVVTIWNKGT